LSLIYIVAEVCSAIIDLYMIKNEKADFTDEIIIRSMLTFFSVGLGVCFAL